MKDYAWENKHHFKKPKEKTYTVEKWLPTEDQLWAMATFGKVSPEATIYFEAMRHMANPRNVKIIIESLGG